jgi:hypothetical protein
VLGHFDTQGVAQQRRTRLGACMDRHSRLDKRLSGR